MTEEDQEATPKSASDATSDADELADFLREFAEYREPEGPADASDFLDIGLPSAAGAGICGRNHQPQRYGDSGDRLT